MQYIQAEDWVNDRSKAIQPGVILFLGEDLSLINSLKQTYVEIERAHETIKETSSKTFDSQEICNANDINCSNNTNNDTFFGTLFDACNMHFIDEALPAHLESLNFDSETILNGRYILTSTNGKIWQKYKNEKVLCVVCDKVQNTLLFMQNWSKYYQIKYESKDSSEFSDFDFSKYMHNLYILKNFWNLKKLGLKPAEIHSILSSYQPIKQQSTRFSYTNTSLFFYNIFMKKDLVEF